MRNRGDKRWRRPNGRRGSRIRAAKDRPYRIITRLDLTTGECTEIIDISPQSTSPASEAPAVEEEDNGPHLRLVP